MEHIWRGSRIHIAVIEMLAQSVAYLFGLVIGRFPVRIPDDTDYHELFFFYGFLSASRKMQV
jgi:hypothetical protein